MLSEKIRSRKKKFKKTNALCAVGDVVRCIKHGKAGQVMTGIVVKKIKRTKKFFDYIYYVATEKGVLKTPDIVISQILSKS